MFYKIEKKNIKVHSLIHTWTSSWVGKRFLTVEKAWLKLVGIQFGIPASFITWWKTKSTFVKASFENPGLDDQMFNITDVKAILLHLLFSFYNNNLY